MHRSTFLPPSSSRQGEIVDAIAAVARRDDEIRDEIAVIKAETVEMQTKVDEIEDDIKMNVRSCTMGVQNREGEVQMYGINDTNIITRH